MDIDAAREAGEIGEEEATQAEDELIERLIAARETGADRTHGGIHEQ